jgi:U3 small nucleolar RNA-associated protein 20
MLLDHLFSTETPSKPFQASLNNLLISLTHHCSSSALQPLVENLLERLENLPVTKTQPVLAFISTLLMTRKGQRFPSAMLRGTMQKLNANVKALQGAEEQWKVAFVGCVVGSLLAGKLAEWLSPGVVLIEGVWNNLVRIRLRIALANEAGHRGPLRFRQHSRRD